MFNPLKKLNEAFSRFDVKTKSTKEEIRDVLEKNGYDTSVEGAENYIDATEEYLQMSNNLGANMTVEEWFAETKMNYPEDLEFMKTTVNESTSLEVGPVKFSSDIVTNSVSSLSNAASSIAQNADKVGGAVAKIAPLLADDASEKEEMNKQLEEDVNMTLLPWKKYYSIAPIEDKKKNEILKKINDYGYTDVKYGWGKDVYYNALSNDFPNGSIGNAYFGFNNNEQKWQLLNMYPNDSDTDIDAYNFEEVHSFLLDKMQPEEDVSDLITGKDFYELARKLYTKKGLKIDSADKFYIQNNPESINGREIMMYDNSNDTYYTATFNLYSDGGMELINFKKETIDLKESLRKIIRKLNEAEISPEDKKDSDLIRSIYKKIQGKKLNPKDLTSEEKEVLDRYGLDAWGYKGDSKVVTGDKRKQIINPNDVSYRPYRWSNSSVYNKSFDKMNLADRARKIDDRDYAQSIENARYFKEPWDKAEKRLYNEPTDKIRRMKSALSSRKYAQKQLSDIDASISRGDADLRYKEEEKAKNRFDDEMNYIDTRLDQTERDIQAILDKHKIKECLYRLNEGEMSEEDKKDSELIRSIYRKIQNRKNAHLTPEEKEVINRYGLSKNTDYTAVDGKRVIGRFDRNPDKINYADKARKIVQRDYAQKVNRNKGYKQTFQDSEMELHNDDISRDVQNMKSKLNDRKYYTDKRDRAINDFNTEISNAKKRLEMSKNRDDEYKDWHKKQIEKSQKEIDSLLGKDKKEESIKGRLKEDIQNSVRVIETGLDPQKGKAILDSVLGQMSDGIWENTSGMDKYWIPVKVVGTELHIDNNRWIKDYSSRGVENPYLDMSDTEVKRFFANKLKTVAREYLNDNNLNPYKDFREDNEEECTYLSRPDAEITIGDAYKAYKILK